jgi:hypothetical protein
MSKQRSPLESKKAGDVAAISMKLREAITCGTCRIGIACDIVGRYWGGDGEAFDWVEENGGHDCALLRDGMTTSQETKVKQVEDEFMGRERAA